MREGPHYGGGVKTLIGLLSVLTGSFLAIIGLLGAMGSALTMKLLPGRRVETIANLPERSAKAKSSKYGQPRVVVRGTVSAGPGGTFRSPLSDQECVWYLATQTAASQGRRVAVDQFAPAPFLLADGDGNTVLVGPECPALEQIAPTFREKRTGPHPLFAETEGLGADVPFEVFEFVLAEGADVLAAGDLATASDGTLSLGGAVALSAAGDAAAEGDPAGKTLPRNLAMAVAGIVLIVMGALVLSYVDEDDFDDNPNQRPGFATPQVLR